MSARHLAAVPEPEPFGIGYIRVSKAREEMISPEIQESTIRDLFARKGIRFAKISGIAPDGFIRDLDRSGKNFAREGIQQAINLVTQGTISEVGVWKWSRFGRNLLASLTNIKRLEEAGGNLQAATEDVGDTRTPYGKFGRNQALLLAELQLDQIAAGWKEAHDHRRKDGLPHAGMPVFGYVYHRCPQGRHPGVGPPCLESGCATGYRVEAGLSSWAAGGYRRYIDGTSYRAIAAWWNAHGIVTVHGNPWTHTSVRGYLNSGFAAGYLHVHKPDCRCGDPNRCKNKIHVPGAHEAIISEDTWQAYLAARDARSKVPARSITPTHPYSRLIFCGGCGGTATACVSNGQPSFRCGSYDTPQDCPSQVTIVQHKVTTAVRAFLAEFAQYDASAAALAERHATATANDTERERLTRAIAKIDKALAKLATDAALNDMPPEAFKMAKDDLTERRAQLAEELARFAPPPELPEHEEVASLLGMWDDLVAEYPGGVRDVLATLIARIEIHPQGSPQRIVIVPRWRA